MTSGSTSATTLSVDDAVHLAYALAAFVAAENGIRSLAIKGPIAHALRVRGPRVSSDADVLVEPHRVADFVSLLAARGWVERRDGIAPRAFEVHSVTMYHPGWPCDIDIHREYPGFFAEPAEVFDALWVNRVEVEIAGRPVISPSRMGSAVVVALHSLKDPLVERSKTELSQVQGFLADASAEELAELIDLVRRTRAVTPIGPLLKALDLDAGPNDLTESENRLWELRVAGDGRSSYHWAIAMASAPWHRRVTLLTLAGLQLLMERDSGAGSAARTPNGQRRSIVRRGWDGVRILVEVRSVERGMRAEARSQREKLRQAQDEVPR